MPPVAPMLAKSVPEIPPGASYEPKWDGFRVDHLPRRRRDRDRQPQREADDPLLPRAGRGLPGRAARALRHRRRDRAGDAGRARLRGPAATHPSGRLAREHAGRADAGVVHRVRPARPRRRATSPASRSHVRRAALEQALATSRAARPPHAGDHRPRRRASAGSPSSKARAWTASSPSRSTVTYQPDKRVMFKIKHARTADCVVAGYRRAQGQRRRDRLAAARPLHRRRHARLGRRDRRVPDGHPQGPVRRAAAAGHDVRRAPVELGRQAERSRAAPAPRGPARARGGTRTRICPSSRCAPSGSSRCATTTWRAPGSGTRPSSRAGAPTATPQSCTYAQLERPVTFELGDIVPGLAESPARDRPGTNHAPQPSVRSSAVRPVGSLAVMLARRSGPAHPTGPAAPR